MAGGGVDHGGRWVLKPCWQVVLGAMVAGGFGSHGRRWWFNRVPEVKLEESCLWHILFRKKILTLLYNNVTKIIISN